MVAMWMSNLSAKSLHTSEVSPAWDCTTKFRNLGRYVCLETIIFSSCDLLEVIKLISGSLCLMVWVEHISECLLYFVKAFVCHFDV